MAKNRKPRKNQTAAEKSPQPFFIGQEISLVIDRLSYHGGRGVGRQQGMVVFVPATAPGDHVRVRIVEVKKNFAAGDLIEVITPGPARRTAPCPVAHRCGGCPWQHISYDEQVRQKAQILEQSLRPLLKIRDFPIRPMIPAPTEFRYRNRIQVHRLGQRIGYFAKGTHDLVDIEDCLLAEEPLIEELRRLRAATGAAALSEEFSRIEVARLQSGEVVSQTGRYEATSSIFSQVNARQNDRLIRVVREALAPLEFAHVFDLFCGTGNFTVPLSDWLPRARITGVELSEAAIARARSVAPTRINWVAASVADFLESAPPVHPLLVILDPPRPGCDDVTIKRLRDLAPEQVIYISCNPMTFSRDAQKLCLDGAYQIEFAQGLDMFPQTEHIELVASFRRTT